MAEEQRDAEVMEIPTAGQEAPEFITCAQFAQRHLVRVRDVKRAAKRAKIGRMLKGVRVFREEEMLDVLRDKIDRVKKLRERHLHYHVLAVDDDVENVETIRRILRKKYKVFISTSGPEALEIFNKEDIEVVIADQRMPEMNGTEMLRRTLEINPNIIRIILSAYTDPEALTDAINIAKVHHFLYKPISRDELLQKVEAAFSALSAYKHIQSIELGDTGS